MPFPRALVAVAGLLLLDIAAPSPGGCCGSQEPRWRHGHLDPGSYGRLVVANDFAPHGYAIVKVGHVAFSDGPGERRLRVEPGRESAPIDVRWSRGQGPSSPLLTGPLYALALPEGGSTLVVLRTKDPILLAPGGTTTVHLSAETTVGECSGMTKEDAWSAHRAVGEDAFGQEDGGRVHWRARVVDPDACAGDAAAPSVQAGDAADGDDAPAR